MALWFIIHAIYLHTSLTLTFTQSVEMAGTLVEHLSTSLSRIIIPLLKQVSYISLSLSLIHTHTHTHSLPLSRFVTFLLQYSDGQKEGNRGVTTIQELIQAFKIAERSSPGFCDSVIQRIISSLER